MEQKKSTIQISLSTILKYYPILHHVFVYVHVSSYIWNFKKNNKKNPATVQSCDKQVILLCILTKSSKIDSFSKGII